MTKRELIASIAKEAKISKAAAKIALDSLLSAISKSLKEGKKVSLVGFGAFSVSKRSARMGRNPRTGAVIQIKTRKVARFRAGNNLSAIINSKKKGNGTDDGTDDTGARRK